ncbi:hypothetical protein Rsub_09361 [Raphidocelis subcapitata]|uniref:Condensation domain-containing protein n=1 Tax=Raphidocelis subcapitata TaxID=307507 RepID=A0A2V0PHS4_9CHLO|nr:hypothetical protein Rsub_09361 [Raphidocelis subcapitata]|eukprot:GBF96615.1 hypothetical protein Rsub_09361 [Raphidocelis subcapitata]
MESIKRAVAVADALLVKSHAGFSFHTGGCRVRALAERRFNAGSSGEVELHALDAQNLRRAIVGTWCFDDLLELPRLQAAFERAVSRYPVVAGWLARAPGRPGTLLLRWDAAARGRGAVWVAAEAAGAPPDILDSLAMQGARLVPPLRRHALLAVTSFPEAGRTLVVASIDHVAADMAAFMDFLSAWCNECAPPASDAASAPAVPMPPPPVWDRSPLAALPPLSFAEAGSSGAGDSEDGDGDGDGGCGGAGSPERAGGGAWSGRARSVASSGAASLVTSASTGSLSSWGSSGSLLGGVAPPKPHRSRLGRFWEGPQVWEADPFCRISGTGMLAKMFWSVVGCRTQSWLLPRAAISDLKARLGPGLPAPPTANDLLCALLAAATAWLVPEKVAARGGMNVNVVINARGRFGLSIGHDFFGNNSFVVPVWVPAHLLPAASDAPLPAPALVAYLHAAVREVLSQPDGLVRRRYEWMAGAQAAGVGGRARACEAVSLLRGDVTVDNVSNFPVFNLKFGAARVAAAATTRFVSSTRLAWITAAGPGPDRAKGGPDGDLLITVPMPAAHWPRLAPHWRAAGLSLRLDRPSHAAAASHPAVMRYVAAEATRTALAGL